jgi:hypothetical protein
MSLAFDPFLPLPAILAIGVIALLLIGWAIAKRMRGAALRALALAALVLALANPVANFEDREPVTSVVAIVVDRSPSQMSGDRTARTDAALKALTERIALASSRVGSEAARSWMKSQSIPTGAQEILILRPW